MIQEEHFIPIHIILLLYLVFQMLPFMLVVVDICGSLMETMD